MDTTLQLTKMRGLSDRIREMMIRPNDNALYFVTGEYARDSYELIKMFDELDHFLSRNDDAEDLPLWWKIDPASTGRVMTGQQKVVSANDPPRMDSPPIMMNDDHSELY